MSQSIVIILYRFIYFNKLIIVNYTCGLVVFGNDEKKVHTDPSDS